VSGLPIGVRHGEYDSLNILLLDGVCELVTYQESISVFF
jgi:hypothetical protein